MSSRRTKLDNKEKQAYFKLDQKSEDSKGNFKFQVWVF